MNRKECAECGGVLEIGFIADRGDHNAVDIPYWVQGEPEQSRFLGMNAGLKMKDRARIDVVTYRCRGCGLLKSYAPSERQRS
jgi:hypothetical protein